MKKIAILILFCALSFTPGCNFFAAVSFISDVLSIVSFIEDHNSQSIMSREILHEKIEIAKYSVTEMIVSESAPKNNVLLSSNVEEDYITYNEKILIDISELTIVQIDFKMQEAGNYKIMLTDYTTFVPSVYLFSDKSEYINIEGSFDDSGILTYKFDVFDADEKLTLLLSDRFYKDSEVSIEFEKI